MTIMVCHQVTMAIPKSNSKTNKVTIFNQIPTIEVKGMEIHKTKKSNRVGVVMSMRNFQVKIITTINSSGSKTEDFRDKGMAVGARSSGREVETVLEA